MKDTLTRRGCIRNAAVGSAALTWLGARHAPEAFASEAGKPALLGGAPAHPGGWSPWPTWRESWEPSVIKVLRSGKWFRGDGGHVAEFEAGYAKLRESFQELKGNQQVCATTVAMPQNLLLADRPDMDHIIEAVRKIQAHSAALATVAG